MIRPTAPINNNIVQNTCQVICGWFTRSDSRDKAALFLNVVGYFQRVECDRCVEVCEEIQPIQCRSLIHTVIDRKLKDYTSYPEFRYL